MLFALRVKHNKADTAIAVFVCNVQMRRRHIDMLHNFKQPAVSDYSYIYHLIYILAHLNKMSIYF